MATPRDHPSMIDAAGAGTFALGGYQTVNRLGLGAMRLAADRRQARALLRRAVELGVRLIDTAEFYGPGTSERLIAEALHPYPDGLVIATKGHSTVSTRAGQLHPVAPAQVWPCLRPWWPGCSGDATATMGGPPRPRWRLP